MVSSAYLNGDFEQTNFQLGYADHSTANAIWELQDERMEKVYRDLLHNTGDTRKKN